MTLQQLSEEYRVSADLCRQRVAELNRQLRDEELSETEKLLLRRRICILSGMVRETASTANYLRTYYGEEN